jgi:hypothetical protein
VVSQESWIVKVEGAHVHGNPLLASDEVFCISKCRYWEKVAVFSRLQFLVRPEASGLHGGLFLLHM